MVKSFAAYVAAASSLSGPAVLHTHDHMVDQPQSVVSARETETRSKRLSMSSKIRSLLDAMREVETGGQPNGGRDSVGDSGKALGPYQIHKVYWQDAIQHDPSLGGKYADVKDRKYAEQVILAYWHRYAPAGATTEQLARIHNGGPKGHQKQATKEYWDRVKNELVRTSP